MGDSLGLVLAGECVDLDNLPNGSSISDRYF